MTENEIIIYGFIMGNSDPQFQHFVRSLSNQDVHNLRKILYQQMYNLEQNGVSAARHGRDRYGFIIVPKIRQQQLWQQSGDRLFSYIKDLWVASVLGYNDPGVNPVKQIQWKSTRARAVTSRREGWQIICSTAIEVGLAYAGARIMIKQSGVAANRVRLQFPKIKDGNGVFGNDGLVIGRYKYEALYQNGGGGTIFSVREVIKDNGKYIYPSRGNLFRLDYNIHGATEPYWHYHYRWLKNGVIKGSTKPHPIFTR